MAFECVRRWGELPGAKNRAGRGRGRLYCARANSSKEKKTDTAIVPLEQGACTHSGPGVPPRLAPLLTVVVRGFRITKRIAGVIHKGIRGSRQTTCTAMASFQVRLEMSAWQTCGVAAPCLSLPLFNEVV